ncbi:MAG: ABC transporter permease [Acidobacteria bacterium]|nr:MAG: ABC transporter permease [Acidobacteriota bacterium]
MTAVPASAYNAAGEVLVNRLLRAFGKTTLLTWDMLRFAFRRPFEGLALLEQMFRLGVRSLPLVGLTAVFTGAVMALQVSYTLAAYGARLYVGSFVSVAIVKELGPVLTAVMIAARVGAGITAELGSMAVTEQIDALRALGASPVKKLVVPRMLALIIMLPLLTILADSLGVLGGLYIAVAEIGQSSEYYWSKVREFLTIGDVVSGTGKTLFFAYFIGIIACFNGLEVRGGATGVGRATTNTVVAASIAIFISNFFLAKLFLFLQTSFGGGLW